VKHFNFPERTMQFNRILALGLACSAALWLAACSNEESAPSAATPSGESTRAKAPELNAAAKDATKHMVTGVTNTAKPGAPVDLRFEIKERPAAGVPLQVEIAFLPQVGSPSLRATFIATDGLAVRPSPVPASYKDVTTGGIYRHTLTVVPREDGAYYVSAIVLMDLDNGPEARTFNLPIVVGAPADVAAKPEPPKDASGQPVESMPANQ